MPPEEKKKNLIFLQVHFSTRSDLTLSNSILYNVRTLSATEIKMKVIILANEKRDKFHAEPKVFQRKNKQTQCLVLGKT